MCPELWHTPNEKRFNMDIVSCCGIMCSECPVYIATERDDDSIRKYLAMQYTQDGAVFYPKDINCHGCHTVSADHNKFGKGCEIRKCCKAKRVKICAECTEYPCSKIEEYVPEGCEHRDRLEEMHDALYSV